MSSISIGKSLTTSATSVKPASMAILVSASRNKEAMNCKAMASKGW
jgi:hypothetical protein